MTSFPETLATLVREWETLKGSIVPNPIWCKVHPLVCRDMLRLYLSVAALFAFAGLRGRGLGDLGALAGVAMVFGAMEAVDGLFLVQSSPQNQAWWWLDIGFDLFNSLCAPALICLAARGTFDRLLPRGTRPGPVPAA